MPSCKEGPENMGIFRRLQNKMIDTQEGSYCGARDECKGMGTEAFDLFLNANRIEMQCLISSTICSQRPQVGKFKFIFARHELMRPHLCDFAHLLFLAIAGL
jgi:hypothetical protein